MPDAFMGSPGSLVSAPSTIIRKTAPVVQEIKATEQAGEVERAARSLKTLQDEKTSQLVEGLPAANGRIGPVRMHQLMESFPELKSGSVEDLRGFAAHTLVLPDESINLRPVSEQSEIGQKGVSGAPVYLAFTPDGRLAAAVKVFPPDKVSQMGGEMFAMQKLQALKAKRLRTVTAMNAGKLPDGSGVLVLSPAQGTTIDDLMIAVGRAASGPEREAALAKLREGVKQNAIALAELHTGPVGSGVWQATAIQGHIAAVHEMTENVIGRLEELQAKGIDFGLNPAELRERATTLATKMWESPGPASFAHGDFHPGNIFHDPDAGITFIDSGNLHLSIGPGRIPVGPPARDVATFDQKLVNLGSLYRLSDKEIGERRGLFTKTYAAKGAAIPAEALAFFRARTALGEFIKR